MCPSYPIQIKHISCAILMHRVSSTRIPFQNHCITSLTFCNIFIWNNLEILLIELEYLFSRQTRYDRISDKIQFLNITTNFLYAFILLLLNIYFYTSIIILRLIFFLKNWKVFIIYYFRKHTKFVIIINSKNVKCLINNQSFVSAYILFAILPRSH